MRSSRSGTVTRIALAVSLLALAPRGAAAEVPADALRGRWCEVRTPHARVLSDAGLARANHVAERIERLYEQVARTAPSLDLEPARARVVFLFRDPATFRAYLPLYRGRPEEDTGLFQASPGDGWLLLQDGPDPQLDPVTLHECTHAILNDAAPGAPLWLNEGLAEYFSTLRVDDADALVGEPEPDLVAWLRRHDLMPIGDLLGMTASSPDYHEGERRGTFYAQSWLLVHLLLNESVGDVPRFERYVGALRRGDEARAAFVATFGEERRVQWRLEVYAQRPRFGGMAWSFARPFSRVRLAAREAVGNGEVVATLGTMLLNRPPGVGASAAEHAAAASALAPGDPAVQALVGTLEAQQRSREPSSLPIRPGAYADDRDRRAVDAFNLGVSALERRDVPRALVQFRAAGAISELPEIRERAQRAVDAILAAAGEDQAREIGALLRQERRAEALRRVDALLAGELDPTLRRGLVRLRRALVDALAGG